MDFSITSPNDNVTLFLPSLFLLIFSRILSNTTIVSLIEYPKIVRIAAINGVSISYLSIAITPKAIITS